MSDSKTVYKPINRSSARALMMLFDACYKMGVKDAIEVDCDMTCEEFCDKMYNTEKFGRVTLDYTYDWREWKYHLCQMVCESSLYRVQGLKFFDSIYGYSNYLACALPIAMDFYLMGIKNYCKHPNSGEWVKFEVEPYAIWGEKSLRKPKMQDFVRIMTGFCYDRIRLDEEAIAFKRRKLDENRAKMEQTGQRGKVTGVDRLPSGLTRCAYETFQREVWRCTRTQSSV